MHTVCLLAAYWPLETPLLAKALHPKPSAQSHQWHQPLEHLCMQQPYTLNTQPKIYSRDSNATVTHRSTTRKGMSIITNNEYR